MLRLARDLGFQSARSLAESLSGSELLEWKAYYLIEASDANPEVTEWDDVASAKSKMAETANSKQEARAQRRRN